MRLIDADKLQAQLQKKKPEACTIRWTEGFNDALLRFKSMISTAPTIKAKIEPTEPCIWCREKILGRMSRFIPYDVGTGQIEYKEEIKFAEDWPVCPECGRSLK